MKKYFKFIIITLVMVLGFSGLWSFTTSRDTSNEELNKKSLSTSTAIQLNTSEEPVAENAKLDSDQPDLTLGVYQEDSNIDMDMDMDIETEEGLDDNADMEDENLSVEEKEEIVEEANEVAEKFDLEPVSEEKLEDTMSEEQMLNFDSVEEFEEFLKVNQQMEDSVENLNSDLSLMASKTKTYSYREKNATGSITSYARVTRNSSGKVSKVNIWSEQTGLVFGITWSQSSTWHTLKSSKKNGTAYVRGTKLYGANVVGQPIGYSKSVTYKVAF